MSGMRAIPLQEILPIMNRLPIKYQAICAIGVTTGCRITEILSLKRFDLITRDGKLKDRIAFLQLKTRRTRKTEKGEKRIRIHRKFTIPETYRPYVIQHLKKEEERGYDNPDDFVFRGQQGKHLSRLTVYSLFRRILGEGYGTHWMRKTFAQEFFHYFLRENQTDPMRALELTRRALGHARVDTTIKYLGILDERMENAQAMIFNEERKFDK